MSLGLQLEEQFLRNRKDVAVVDSNARISFEDLWCAAVDLAQTIRKKEIYDSPVAYIGRKSIDGVIATLGIALSGNYFVPLESRTPTARLQQQIRRANPAAVVLPNKSTRHQKFGQVEDQIVLGEFTNSKGRDFQKFRAVEVIDTSAAYVMFTSGSTGEPKGAVISHAGICNYLTWIEKEFSVGVGDRIANQAPFTFDNSLMDIFSMALTGAQLHLVPESLFAMPEELVKYLQDSDISQIFWVPTAMHRIAKTVMAQPVPTLRKILFAGEVISPVELQRWQTGMPWAEYVNLYGPTEASVDCLYHRVDEIRDVDVPVPIGQPTPGAEVFLVRDFRTGVGPENEGEIFVRGVGVGLGYLNDVDATKDAFVQNPLHSLYRDICYRTGDFAIKDVDGNFIFMGRKDRQVKVYGQRIELDDVEATLAKALGASSVAVELIGSNIVAAVAAQSPEEAQEALSRVPRSFHVKMVLVDDLPTLPSGKINRPSLRARLQYSLAEVEDDHS